MCLLQCPVPVACGSQEHILTSSFPWHVLECYCSTVPSLPYLSVNSFLWYPKGHVSRFGQLAPQWLLCPIASHSCTLSHKVRISTLRWVLLPYVFCLTPRGSSWSLELLVFTSCQSTSCQPSPWLEFMIIYVKIFLFNFLVQLLSDFHCLTEC